MGRIKYDAVYAKPVFMEGFPTPESLPLEAVFNHSDCVDLISAREFDLYHQVKDKNLLCIIVSATEGAMDEMEQLICGRSFANSLVAECQADGEEILVKTGEEVYRVKGKLDADMHESIILKTAVITQWCEEYPVKLYWPQEA